MMKQYSHILAVIEPKRDHQLALERAVQLANFNPHADITALRLIYDFSNDIHIIGRNQEKETKAEVEKEYLKQLKQMLEPYRNEEIRIIPKLVWAKDLGESIIEQLQKGGYDLLLKGANHHSVLDSIIFTPLDWYLLRNSPVPVIIAKCTDWQGRKDVLAAMDFSSAQKRMTNLRLLREAQLAAKMTGGQVHLVNSAPVMLPAIMMEVPHYTPELYAENIIAEHSRRLTEFAKLHGIPEQNCHIAEGMPDDVIPNLCREIKPAAVIIGSAGRQGALAALIGNTCEEIVDYIDADLLVFNHQTVDRRTKS